MANVFSDETSSILEVFGINKDDDVKRMLSQYYIFFIVDHDIESVLRIESDHDHSSIKYESSIIDLYSVECAYVDYTENIQSSFTRRFLLNVVDIEYDSLFEIYKKLNEMNTFLQITNN